jgi:predicted regulator of Ras-like GTPase activity (Roadblock/LC7/MglB family)
MRAQAALPSSLVELGLKRGRVTVPWKNLRTMIRPNPLPVSVHDGVELELPLKVLAPLFFAGQKAAGAVNQKTSVLAEIPDLFQDSKKVEAVKPPAHLPRGITMPTGSSQAQMPASRGEPVPAPTLSAAVDAKADGANVFSKAQTLKAAGSEPEASGSDFKPPSATPRDIVARTLALPGVAGAVIALYDGLMIASEVPPGFNADTAAAFLPQIFDRVSHNTRELHMGMLNKLEFTVGDVSWQIFRVNAIYFAAFSRAGEPLPMAQIALLAGELDRRKE